MSGNKVILDNFQDLLEVVTLQNFDELTKELPEDKPIKNSVYKKAVKIGNAPKKAILISKAPPKKVKKGGRFTDKKICHHGRMIHFTNAKNSFKRAQNRKSRKK